MVLQQATSTQKYGQNDVQGNAKLKIVFINKFNLVFKGNFKDIFI